MRFFVSLCALLLFSLPALAEGELFIKKHKSDDRPAYTAKPKAPGAPENQIEGAYVSKALANNYYKNCKKGSHPVLKGNSLEALCACTAAKITEEMNVSEIEALFSDTPESQNARDKMLMMVYAPCMQYPVRDLIVDNCVNNKDLSKIPINKQKICGCMGGKMGEYMAANAPNVIAQALRDNPGTQDPLASFFQSYAFKTASRQHMKACLFDMEVQRRQRQQ